MFSYSKWNRQYRKAVSKIHVPELNLHDMEAGNLYPKDPIWFKRKTCRILRACACFVFVAVIVGISVFYNSGGILSTKIHSDSIPTNTTASQNSFTLIAYAAAVSSTSSNAVTDSSETIAKIDMGSKTILNPNDMVTLPGGKIERSDQVPPQDIGNGKIIYDYKMPQGSIFQIKGNAINSVELSAKSGFLTKYSDDHQFEAAYIAGNVASVTTHDYIVWRLRSEDLSRILTSSNFTDFFSIPTDTISITIHFNDGSTKNATVKISFDSDGSMISKLSFGTI